MTAKKVSAKDFLINNGIIVVLLLLAVFTAIKQPTFFSGGNFINIALNVAPRFIIACGVSGCLITKGTDLSAGRMVGLSACLAGTLLQKPDYSGKFFQNLPDFGNAWGLWVLAVLLICVVICCIFYQWYRNFLLTGSGLHRNTWYAADRLRCLPCLHKRDSDRWISQCVHSSSKRKTLWRDPVPVPDRPCGWSCYVVHL